MWFLLFDFLKQKKNSLISNLMKTRETERERERELIGEEKFFVVGQFDPHPLFFFYIFMT